METDEDHELELNAIMDSDGVRPKVFIGNLPSDCIQADMEQIFTSVGFPSEEISKFDIRLVRDRETDQFKGFSYVELCTKEQLDVVLTLNGVEYGGKKLRVDVATGKGGRGGSRGGRGGDRGGFRGDRGGLREERGGFRGERSFVGRGRDRGRGGPSRDDEVIVSDDAERPRLRLAARSTDPADLEKKKEREAAEAEARRKQLFGN